jgi:hypothetical protein
MPLISSNHCWLFHTSNLNDRACVESILYDVFERKVDIKVDLVFVVLFQIQPYRGA